MFVRTTAEGGRRTPVNTGYRPQALLQGVIDLSDGDARREVIFNDCQLGFDGGPVEPGGEAANVRVYPFSPEYWGSVRPGDVVGLYEGWRLVGSLRIVASLES